ncbi:MAG: T9SS C-terminal target domain-containing protein [Bacteroidetes bacterium]|nr:MAG: T9SS C-terminal target domain-containing protein [Bacteroidota bacterium]MBL1144806.1 T9SS C-terminal target domain-containing protein [Bacteroidota bacterium]MCB0803134.1 T9SS type A sorting domain-containing protein [Flavobacteriales bacterium]NOG57600.1 T9SS type A sorting domain-containing protein [Bacteroidota bacterium]
MKKFLLVFFTIFTYHLYAQVTLDQVIIKIDSIGYDTAFIRYTSHLNKPVTIGGVTATYPNGCHYLHTSMDFQGSLTLNPITRDTFIRVGYLGLVTDYIRINALWDTATTPPPPPTPKILLDQFIYDSCFTTKISETRLRIETELFPNPASNYFKVVSKNNSEKIKLIELFNINGKSIKRFKYNSNNTYNTSKLSSGVYFVFIYTTAGRNSHKLIINK